LSWLDQERAQDKTVGRERGGIGAPIFNRLSPQKIPMKAGCKPVLQLYCPAPPATTTTNRLSNSPLVDHIVLARSGASVMTN
jgi:hypothetical protein